MSEPDYNDIVYRLRNPTYWFFQIVGPKSGASFNGESDAPRDAADEIEQLREENARLEESNKKLNDDLLKQAELTAVTMTRCADLMPAQSAIVKLKDQQAEIDALKAEVARLKGETK